MNNNEFDKLLARQHITWMLDKHFITWDEYKLLIQRTTLEVKSNENLD